MGIARLDRTEARNALSPELMAELVELVEGWDADPELRSIVIAGGDDWFSAGADIKSMAERTFADTLTSSADRFWSRLAAVRTPLIAAVSGYALGGGCELALVCDMIVASESAEFGQPEILLGIIPGGGGTQRLARLVGPARAKDLILTGRQVKAPEALAMGLVDEVVPAGELHDRVLARAAELARGAVVAQGMALTAIDRGLDGTLADGLALEQRLFAAVFDTEDAQTGVASFKEHGPGKATFHGR